MFHIVVNSSSDLPKSFIEEHNLGCLNLSYILDGETYGHGKELEAKQFYQMMRDGAKPTTSQVNPDEAKEYLLSCIGKYDEVLCMGFSSGLSGTTQSIRIAAEEIREEHPGEIRIEVIDTLCASLGEGLIDYYAIKMRDEGKSMDEVIEWVEANKLHFVHTFTVDNLYDLWRGGRVSKTSAFIGTLISIKPRMYVNDEGKLLVVDKIRGRKKSLDALVDYMEEKMGTRKDWNKEMIMIAHGDCIEDAEYVRDVIKERYGFENFLINNLGPVIGSHTGPSLVALFFVGDVR